MTSLEVLHADGLNELWASLNLLLSFLLVVVDFVQR